MLSQRSSKMTIQTFLSTPQPLKPEEMSWQTLTQSLILPHNTDPSFCKHNHNENPEKPHKHMIIQRTQKKKEKKYISPLNMHLKKVIIGWMTPSRDWRRSRCRSIALGGSLCSVPLQGDSPETFVIGPPIPTTSALSPDSLPDFEQPSIEARSRNRYRDQVTACKVNPGLPCMPWNANDRTM